MILRILLFSFFLPLATAHAQESGSGAVTESGAIVLTGSGRTASDILESLSARTAEESPPRSFTELMLPEKLTAARDAQENKIRERLLQLRRECHEALRRANRDTLPPTANRCMRGELLLEMNMLRKQKEEFARMPTLPPEAIAEVAHSTDNLIEAQATMIDGIDAGVFSTVDLLKEAKKNLHTQYRLPVRRAFLRARAERIHAWSALLASMLLPMISEDAESTTLARTLEAVDLHASAVRGTEDAASRSALEDAYQDIDTFKILLFKYINAQQEK